MKKILLLIAFSISLLIGADIVGFIEKIDNTNKTITVNKTVIQVYPYTKIEKDACWGFDRRLKFQDLKISDLVEVDILYYQDIPMAEEIEVKCNNSIAY